MLAVCADYRERDAAEAKRAEKAPPRLVRRGQSRRIRRELRDLRRIRPPSTLRPTVRRWLAAGGQLARIIDDQERVLTRDSEAVFAELKQLDLPRRKPTREELAHPTAALFEQLYAHSPAWRRFYRDVDVFVNRSAQPRRRFEQLAAELRVRACLR